MKYRDIVDSVMPDFRKISLEEKVRIMGEKEQLDKALAALEQFVGTLAAEAGMGREHGERLWQGIQKSEGLLRELAYYHDYGEFLCRYEVAGHTLADVLVWQVEIGRAHV